MNIEEGFKIDNPDIFIEWNIDEQTLISIFSKHKLKHVTTGYYVTNCECLGGLKCNLGFHFEPRKSGKLKELEFFRTDYSNQVKSFDEFQDYFEKAFGKPTSQSSGNEGFPNYEWSGNKIQIVHYVFDRFGPEEHMRVRNLDIGSDNLNLTIKSDNKMVKDNSKSTFAWLKKLFS